MKKQLMATFLVCLCAMQSFSQQDSLSSLRNALLTKSKNQKTAAWVMLAGGATLTAAGVLLFDNAIDDSGEDGLSLFGPFISLIGVGSMIGSIPLFFASARTKKKAMTVTVSTQQIMTPLKGGWGYQRQPAITLTVPIGAR